ncbi:MAG TPA: class I SAM-dependent methyltransferase [Candidatus Binatia bacterium]|nr:class I SAM-dependent methyltransferase [Candidatus Binatia bacterium]
MEIIAAPTRKDLVQVFNTIGTRVLEIGVGDGSFSRIILECDPAIELTAIDPFSDPEGEIPDFYDHETNHRKVISLENEFRSRYNFIFDASPGGLDSVADGSIDWVFVDGDHQVSGALADIQVAQRIVRAGGIIACHDFAVHDRAVANLQEVVEATEIYLNAHRDTTFYGIDLSVYSTSILIKEPSKATAAHIGKGLKPWILYSFQNDDPSLQAFAFKEELVRQADRFVTCHEIRSGEEMARFETVSERVFSGYYNNISARLL